MKTLIIYFSKYGATREIAQRIADKIPGSLVCNLKETPTPPIGEYDTILIGGAVYAGSINKTLKTFVTKNTEVLSKKRLGLFLSGIDGSKAQEYFERNYPSDILACAAAKSFCGGELRPENAKGLMHYIIKSLAEKPDSRSGILDEAIIEFAEAMGK